MHQRHSHVLQLDLQGTPEAWISLNLLSACGPCNGKRARHAAPAPTSNPRRTA